MRRFNKKRFKSKKKKEAIKKKKLNTPIVKKIRPGIIENEVITLLTKSNDYLKFYSSCFNYIIARYNLSHSDIGLLLFLHSEGIFNGMRYAEYRMVSGFTTYDLQRMIKRGYVIRWSHNSDKRRILYKISDTGSSIVNKLYRLLNGDDNFSTNPLINKLKRNTNSTMEEYSASITLLNHQKNKHVRKIITTSNNED